MPIVFSSYRKITFALCLLFQGILFQGLAAQAQQGDLLKQGQWTVGSPACSSLPLLQVHGPGTLFDPANAAALSDLQHSLAVLMPKACPGVREAILVNGRGRRLIRIEGSAAPAAGATPSPASPPEIGLSNLNLSNHGASGVAGAPQSARLQVQQSIQPVKADFASTNRRASGGPESPFIDLVQFRSQPVRRPVATEHRDEHAGVRVSGNIGDYALGQFVSIISRALDNKESHLVLGRLPNGKWIPATVRFTMPDPSFATSGYPYLGRIIASKPSDFIATLSEDGIVTGKETGSTDDLRGSGVGYPPTGSMTWTGIETLDLNSGLDNWTFRSEMEGRYPRSGLLGRVKGTLTASDSVHADFAIVAGIDESRTKGDATVASDPANSRALIIGDLKFRSSTGASKLRFSDRGVLSVPLINRAGLDLNELHYSVTTGEKIDGILDAGKLSGAFRMARDSRTDLLPVVGTTFGIPAGGVNFVVTISYRNTVLGRRTLNVPTEPFYRDSQVHLSHLTAPRLEAVAKYFGTDNTAYGDPGPELAASAGRDPLAAMWEAAFEAQGAAGYTFDREKAYQVARRVLPQLEKSARGGDAEGLYLFFYACQLGLEGENGQAEAGQFLDRAAQAGFLPAKFDRALLLSLRKDDANALAAVKEAYDAGVKRAAFVAGKIYEQGIGVDRDPEAALKWYRSGADFGDPAALLGLAGLTAKGVSDAQPDPAKAMQLARQAALRRYSGAYLFMGRAYASGRQGVKQDTALAIEAFKKAADLGDRDAMLELGVAYLGVEPGFTADERAGVYWIRKAAERDSPRAMLFLWQFYKEGNC